LLQERLVQELAPGFVMVSLNPFFLRKPVKTTARYKKYMNKQELFTETSLIICHKID
jgi:hypothetical protein